MFLFMFLPVGLVLEWLEFVTKGTAVLGLCLRGWNSRRRERLGPGTLRCGFRCGLMIR